MKQSLTLLIAGLLAVISLLTTAQTQYGNDAEFVTALDWMYSQGLTRYDTTQAFRPGDQLTRQEAAKFFSSVLAFTTLPADQNRPAFDCDFQDSASFDETLAESIALACSAGLMRGYDGQFHPRDVLTKAEALTILIRMQDGLLPEDQQPRWSNYYANAYNAGITREDDETKIPLPVTRYEAALLLNRQYGVPVVLDDTWSQPSDTPNPKNTQAQEAEVKDSLWIDYLRTE